MAALALTAADGQPSLWDGEGVDPWLPSRLAASADIAAAERRMYNHWWGSFSDFLVRSRRSVLSGPGVPDPHGVMSAAPAWAKDMRRFVQGPVRDTVGLAFQELFGNGFDFDQRPAVTAYLAQVTNRMVRTPDDVFGVVAAEVARGAAAGDSIPKVAERIDRLLGSTDAVENWGGRAVTVARTETIGALNFGRFDSFREMDRTLGGGMQSMWLATIDPRTRLDHAHADGQRVPVGQPFLVGGEKLMFPGDPSGSAANVINCRCTTLLVSEGEVLDMTGRGWTDWEDADVPGEPPKPDPALVPHGEAAKYHTSLAGIQSLAHSVEAGPLTQERRLTGGFTAVTDLKRAADGTEVVVKKASQFSTSDAEQGGSMIARALGLPAPTVYRTAPGFVHMEYITDAETAYELAAAAGQAGAIEGYNAMLAEVLASDEGVVTGLLDHLIANVDRNPGNFMIRQGGASTARLVPIDHGNAWFYGDPVHTPGPGWARGPFAAIFSEDRTRWEDVPLTKADIATARARLEKLRPQFVQIGREDWLDYSLGVLDEIEPHAVGTRDLIGAAI